MPNKEGLQRFVDELKGTIEQECPEPDSYFFDLNAFDYNLSITERTLRVTRKKPKVCVEWRLATTVYKNEMAGPCGQGELYRVVQFRVTGDLNSEYVYSYRDKGLMAILTPHCTVSSFNLREPVNATDVLHIATDAHSKWSHPVLLPESIFSRLDEITKALEDRANGGKG